MIHFIVLNNKYITIWIRTRYPGLIRLPTMTILRRNIQCKHCCQYLICIQYHACVTNNYIYYYYFIILIVCDMVLLNWISLQFVFNIEANDTYIRHVLACVACRLLLLSVRKIELKPSFGLATVTCSSVNSCAVETRLLINA